MNPEHRSHLFDYLELLGKVLFKARVNRQQPETSKTRLEAEKVSLAVSDNSDPGKQTRSAPHAQRNIPEYFSNIPTNRVMVKSRNFC